MFLLRPPSDAEVRRRLERLADAPVTHPHDGLTRAALDVAPEGYTLDVYTVELGRGVAVFDRASAAVARFEHYPDSFSRVVPLGPVGEDLSVGLVFGTVATHFGFASIHPCRVTFVIDETAPLRSGFGLGTLRGHIARGEECFEVVMNDAEHVRLDVRAISRPADLFARLGRPILRAYQTRFQRELAEGMRARCAAH